MSGPTTSSKSDDPLVQALIANVPKQLAALSLIGSYALIREVIVDLRLLRTADGLDGPLRARHLP